MAEPALRVVETDTVDRKKALEAALGQIDRAFGKGSVMKLGARQIAADIGVDLIVMGIYGHSRMREFVLGGASRTLLTSMTVPVLMSH